MTPVVNYLTSISEFIDLINLVLLCIGGFGIGGAIGFFVNKRYWLTAGASTLGVGALALWLIMPSAKPVDLAKQGVEVTKQVLENDTVKAGTEAAKGWLLKKAEEAKELVK